MQITGWGFTDFPIVDKNGLILNNLKKSRFLRVAWVDDYTPERGEPDGDVCDKDETKIICVYNGTWVPNSDFAKFSVGF